MSLDARALSARSPAVPIPRLPGFPPGLLLVFVAVLSLSACSSRQLVAPDRDAAADAFRQRAAGLESLTAWDLSGKLSIDDGKDGGSGRLSWQIRNTRSQMNFRGALGKGAWQLSSGPGYAQLNKADGSVISSQSVDELVASELGWRIPVNSLKWWALGLPAPGGDEQLDLDSKGRVLVMQQHGWNISFERYRMFGDVELPGRMDAVSGHYRVKMAISSWTLPAAAQPDD